MLALIIVSRSATKAIANVSAIIIKRLYREGDRFRFIIKTDISIAAFLPFLLLPVIIVIVYSLVILALYFFTYVFVLASCY